MSVDLGVIFSADGGAGGSYTDRNGLTRSNATLVNGSYVGMNTTTIPTAAAACDTGSATAWVYVHLTGAGATSVDVELLQSYGGSDANVSSAPAAITVYDNAGKTNTNAANFTASGVYRLDTANLRNGGRVIVKVQANGGLANGDAVKVALVGGGS
jgi:hypothetical protein